MKQLVIFIFSMAILFAQESYNLSGKTSVLGEAFDDNRNAWPDGIWETGSGQVSSGRYIFKYQGEGRYYSTIDKELDLSKDFEIEAGMQWMNGANDYGFGITFGYADVDNNYVFHITANGYFHFGRWINGDIVNIIEWTESSAIKQNVNLNYLRIKKQGGQLLLYINDSYVGQASAEPFFGNGVGMVINKQMQVNYYRYNINYLNSSSNSYSSNSYSMQSIYKTTFDSDQNWYVGSDDDQEMKYQTASGFTWYSFEHKRSYSRYYSSFPVKLDYNSDFSINTGIQWMSGNSSEHFGLSIGYDQPSTNLTFTITSNGYYKVTRWENSNASDLISQSYSSAIKTGVNLNYLKIKRSGSMYYFFINDTQVTSLYAPQISGAYMGYVIHSNQRITAFRFEVEGSFAN